MNLESIFDYGVTSVMGEGGAVRGAIPDYVSQGILPLEMCNVVCVRMYA